MREIDLNYRPSGYEPNELPDCSIPQNLMDLTGCVTDIFSSIPEAVPRGIERFVRFKLQARIFDNENAHGGG